MTIGGALKQVVVASGLYGERVWRERPVPPEQFPYCTFDDPTSLTPQLQGDGGRAIARRRLIALDSWQAPDDLDALDRFAALVAAVDQAQLVGAQHAFRCRVTQAVLVPEDDVIHHSLTVMVDHVA